MDEETILRATMWMVKKQAADGSFPEPGRIIHKEMMVCTDRWLVASRLETSVGVIDWLISGSNSWLALVGFWIQSLVVLNPSRPAKWLVFWKLNSTLFSRAMIVNRQNVSPVYADYHVGEGGKWLLVLLRCLGPCHSSSSPPLSCTALYWEPFLCWVGRESFRKNPALAALWTRDLQLHRTGALVTQPRSLLWFWS